MNNYDYPWGADGPDAPWNQNDPIMKECHVCEGHGTEPCCDCEEGEDEDGAKCLTCSGTGKVPCSECEGGGEIEADPEDYEPDPDRDRD